MRTEPRPQVTCTENLVNYGHVVFETYERTDRHTNIHTYKHTVSNTLYTNNAGEGIILIIIRISHIYDT